MTTSPAAALSIAVLGCGWLGLPLAKALVAAGHTVAGTTTTPAKVLRLQAAGIMPYLLRLGPDFSATDADTLRTLLTDVDVLVLNVPPRRTTTGVDYPALLQPIREAAEACQVPRILFVSSTGVYPDEARTMTEADALASPEAGSDMLRAEALFSTGPWQTTVVRLAGLVGPDRLPGRFLAGKQDVAQPLAPVNLIHLTDCVGLLTRILQAQAWGYTFNAAAAQHPTRQEFYTQAAQHLRLTPPQFREEVTSGKSIDSTLVRETTGYAFQHDDLLAALADC